MHIFENSRAHMWRCMCSKLDCNNVHKYVNVILLFLQKILLNIAIYNYTFVNLSPISTVFGILVNTDIVDRTHDFGCHGIHFGGKICFTIVTKMGILLN